MTNTVIQLKSSGTPSNIPNNLANGEIALNYADGKFFYKNVTGQIVSFAGSGNVYSFATINANNSLITAESNTSILTLKPGNNIEITGDIINDVITINANTIIVGSIANSKAYVIYQELAPALSNAHDFWVNSSSGVLYQNFGTTTSPVWAEFGPTSTVAGATGTVLAANLVFGDSTYQTTAAATTTNASAAFAKANSALQNTTGTFDGTLTVTGNTTVNGIAPNYAPNRPAFRVVGGGTTNNLTITQNGTGCLTSNNWTVSYNQGGYLANTNGVFTAPVTGLYQVNVIGRNSGYASGISQIGVTKNGSSGGTVGGECILMVEWAASSSMNHAGGSTIIHLASGDTLACKILAGQINFDGNDNWSVAYIG